ncbi:MAG: flagellar hook-associated protein FlgK [Candidatus Korobacteraceae bacterium]
MSSLLGTMSIALGALQAQQAGLQTTTNNIANQNTPGYTRERVLLEEADPTMQNGMAFGNGVDLKGVQSLRDSILELQIGDETQQQGKSQALVNAMSQVQTLFPDDTTGIGQQISNFFQSLNNLSTNPSDTTLRQNVLSAAQGVATAFNGAANRLSGVSSGIDQNVEQAVGQVNQLTQQIADINSKLNQISSTGQGHDSFLDQRGNLVQHLSSLIDVSVINDGSSLTLTTKQGTALVVDGKSFGLTTALDTSSGTQHIYSQDGSDITGKISGGQLGGLLEARDQSLTSVQTQLDSLASGFSQALNAAQAKGFDLNGAAGGNLFTTVTGAGAAAGMKVAITDPALLAASSDGSTGSNGNLANLSAVANQAVSNGLTPTQSYASLVFQSGSAVSDSTAELNASNTMLQQLQQQESSVSGVSMDEEASNLLQYQRAYQAAAEAISTVNQMLQTAINMKAAT